MRLRNVWVGALGRVPGVGRSVRRRCSTSEDSDIPSEAAGAATSGSGPKVDAATAGELKGAVALNGSVAQERSHQDERRSGLPQGSQGHAARKRPIS